MRVLLVACAVAALLALGAFVPYWVASHSDADQACRDASSTAPAPGKTAYLCHDGKTVYR